MKIYKLTGIDGGDVVLGEGQLRYENIVEIVRVDNDRTRITLRIPGTEADFSLTDYKTHHYLVKETPADILAMIEAGEASSPGLAAERPRTITVDELLVGDHVVGLPLHDGEGAYHSSDGMRHFFNNIGGRVLSSLEKRTVSALLARGMQVYRDGKLISGWPIGGEPDNFDWQSCYRAAEADVKKHEARITELEAEVKSWKDAANSGHLECEEAYVYDAAELLERIDEFERRIKSREATIAELEAELAAAKDRIRAYQNAAFPADYPNPKTPMRLAAELETLQQRIATTAAELAAAKARPVEPPPLDKARVFATAESIALSLVRDSLWDNTNTAAETESRLWSMVQEILKRAKWQLNGHGAKPYKVE